MTRNPLKLAEGMGFEPTIRFNPYNGLANRRFALSRPVIFAKKWLISAAFRQWIRYDLGETKVVRDGTKAGTAEEHQMAGDIHELAVDHILRRVPEAKARGFMKALRAIAFPDNAAIVADGSPPEDFDFVVIPDAYLIDEPTKTLTVFEVEDGHPVPIGKMDTYCAIFQQLDGEGWFMFVETCNRWGGVIAHIDMEEFADRRRAQRMGKVEDRSLPTVTEDHP